MWAALLGLVAGDWTWTRIPASGLKPAVRSGHASVEVDGKVYVIGGCLLDVQCFNDVHIFDPETQTWSQPALSGNAPEPRGGHTATLVGASIFVVGGSSPEATFNDAFELDLIARRWRRCATQGVTPPARTGHAADTDGEGNVVIFGGVGSDGQYLGELWLLNVFYPHEWLDKSTTPVTWVPAVTEGTAPAAREGHSLTVIRRKAFVFGGYTVGGLSNDLQILALDSLRWEEVVYSGFGPSPRQGHAAARHGDSLVVVGGCQVSPAECFGDAYSLDTKTLAWTSESSDKVTFSPREGHTASFIRGRLVVIGGCELFTSCYNDVTVLDTGDPCAGSCGAQGACEGDGAAAYCQCRPGFSGHDCLTTVPCPFKCHGHGQCLSTGRCGCDNGFGGASCEIDFRCPGNGNCNGQGKCTASGICSCYNGFSGPDCSAGQASCPKGGCGTALLETGLEDTSSACVAQPCSGRGTCTSEATCKCNLGFHGPACEGVDTCPLGCCAHGTCTGSACACDRGWHGPSCSLQEPAWAWLGQQADQRAGALRDSAKTKRNEAHEVGQVAQVLLDAVGNGTGAAEGKGKAAALQLQAAQLLDDAAQLERLATAAATDRLAGLTADVAGGTCTPDLNGLLPAPSSAASDDKPDLGLVRLLPNTPVSLASRSAKVPPPIPAQKAKVADPKAFGVYENNGKIKVPKDEVCKDNCNFRGICKDNVCYCEPSFYGETCESTRTKKTGTISLENVIVMAGGVVIVSFVATLGFLQYQAIKRRQKEHSMGFAL